MRGNELIVGQMDLPELAELRDLLRLLQVAQCQVLVLPDDLLDHVADLAGLMCPVPPGDVHPA